MNDGLTEAYSVARKMFSLAHWFGFHKVCPSPNIKGMNSRSLRWTESVEITEEITNATELNLQTRGTRNYKS
jgi:hypothetical protein